MAVVCASLVFLRQADAELITYEMTGSVDSSVIAGINAGDPFHGRFTHDTAMPLVHTDEIIDPFGEASARWGVYQRQPPHQPLGMSATFGTRTVATSDSIPLYLTVFDAIKAQKDSFEFLGHGLSDPGFSHLSMKLALRAPGQDLFSGIKMPASLDLAEFPHAKVYFSVPGELAPPELSLNIETLNHRSVFTSFELGPGGTSFGDAIAGGNIQPVETGEMTGSAIVFFTDQVRRDDRVDAFEQTEVSLTPGSPADVAGADGMVASWEQTTEDILHVVIWEFTYDQDPDFTNTEISFSMLPPEGVTHLGIELIDVHGYSRGWMLSDPESILGECSIRADLAEPQDPFTAFLGEESDFDITQVLAIRITEASIGSGPFPDPDPIGDGEAWSAWGRLSARAVPEQSIHVMPCIAMLPGGEFQVTLEHLDESTLSAITIIRWQRASSLADPTGWTDIPDSADQVTIVFDPTDQCQQFFRVHYGGLRSIWERSPEMPLPMLESIGQIGYPWSVGPMRRPPGCDAAHAGCGCGGWSGVPDRLLPPVMNR